MRVQNEARAQVLIGVDPVPAQCLGVAFISLRSAMAPIWRPTAGKVCNPAMTFRREVVDC